MVIQQLEKRNVKYNTIEQKSVNGSIVKVIIIHQNELSKLPESSKYNQKFHWYSQKEQERLGTNCYLPFDKKCKNGCGLTRLVKGLMPKLLWDHELESVWTEGGRVSSVCW